jgi:ethanolamine utilization protein EutQ (cupin superfamily)
MPVTLITDPVVIQAAGTPPKEIREYVGRVRTQNEGVSVALMDAPAGWAEPGQTPEFDEVTVVLEGTLIVEHAEGSTEVAAGHAVVTSAGEWIRYSTVVGARYAAVCTPAFSPDTVHRDE